MEIEKSCLDCVYGFGAEENIKEEIAECRWLPYGDPISGEAEEKKAEQRGRDRSLALKHLSDFLIRKNREEMRNNASAFNIYRERPYIGCGVYEKK